jgi:hypothetical protein
MQNEQALQERSRDLELRDIKIESLESVLKRRDQQLNESTSETLRVYESKVKGLESDRDKLIKDNIALIR